MTMAMIKEEEQDEAKKKPLKRKSRLILRLGSFLVSHSVLVRYIILLFLSISSSYIDNCLHVCFDGLNAVWYAALRD